MWNLKVILLVHLIVQLLISQANGQGYVPPAPNYNERCSLSYNQCNSSLHLRCSNDNYCSCEVYYTYNNARSICEPIEERIQDPNSKAYIKSDIECQNGEHGRHSRCIQATDSCGCFDVEQRGERPTIYRENICWIVKSVGDTCLDNRECSYTIEGEAICKREQYENSNMGRCACGENSVWANSTKGGCYPIPIISGDLSTAKCIVDEQCIASTLGSYSRCNSETCQCYDHSNPGEENAIFYNSKCYQRKRLQDPCENDEECIASIHPDAKCLATDEAYTRMSICQCPDGKTCSSASTIKASLIFLIVILWIQHF